MHECLGVSYVSVNEILSPSCWSDVGVQEAAELTFSATPRLRNPWGLSSGCHRSPRISSSLFLFAGAAYCMPRLDSEASPPIAAKNKMDTLCCKVATVPLRYEHASCGLGLGGLGTLEMALRHFQYASCSRWSLHHSWPIPRHRHMAG